MHTGTQADEASRLNELATELDALGLHTALLEPPSRPPYLHVRNPRANALTENVSVHSGRYYFSWAEPIAGCGEPATAAAIVARVLRTTDRQQP